MKVFKTLLYISILQLVNSIICGWNNQGSIDGKAVDFDWITDIHIGKIYTPQMKLWTKQYNIPLHIYFVRNCSFFIKTKNEVYSAKDSK